MGEKQTTSRSTRINVTFEKYDIARIDKYVGKDKEFSSRAALVQRSTLKFLDYLEGTIFKEEK